jgi:hypothetical protein
MFKKAAFFSAFNKKKIDIHSNAQNKIRIISHYLQNARRNKRKSK